MQQNPSARGEGNRRGLARHLRTSATLEFRGGVSPEDRSLDPFYKARVPRVAMIRRQSA
jgi:hypothetical protein